MDLSVYLRHRRHRDLHRWGSGRRCGCRSSGGHWSHLDAAARVVLDDDEPMPTREKGAY